MTCTTCGAVGTPGATWCSQCYLPYARAGAPIPPPPNYIPTPQYATAGAYASPPTMPSYPSGNYSDPYPYGQPQQNWPESLGLVVPQLAVETGDLPQVCVVSGVPTSNMVRMRWMWAPWWTVFLGLIIRYFLADKVAGYLPIAPAVRRRQVLTIVGSLVGFFVGFVTLIVGMGDQQPVAVLLGLVLFVGSVVLVAVKGSLVKVKRAAPGYLAIRNAHPAFVQAFHAGRPAGVTPYRNVPAKLRAPRWAYVVAAIFAPLAILSGVMTHVTGPEDGCGCRHSPAAAPPVVFTQPGVGQCAVISDLDVAPIKDAVSKRDKALVRYGLTPTSAKAISAIRKRDLALVAEVNRWGLSDLDMAVKGHYVAALGVYDASLGTSGAAAAASAMQAREQTMLAVFAAPPVDCSTA